DWQRRPRLYSPSARGFHAKPSLDELGTVSLPNGEAAKKGRPHEGVNPILIQGFLGVLAA
ncbi:MAG: hypothetical protein JSV00_02540, partial [bacterium]